MTSPYYFPNPNPNNPIKCTTCMDNEHVIELVVYPDGATNTEVRFCPNCKAKKLGRSI